MNNENDKFNQNINNGQINSVYQQFNNSQNSGINNMNQSIQQSKNENNISLQTRKINKFAIYSIISSFVSLFLFWWLASIGIGYGIKSLKDSKEKGEKGRILAILGIIIGIISISLYFISRVGLLN